ncbi:hypothetical protein F5Y15DRAFT_333731 [Xylariaceae sp. FL0016]|nr:hypothetical protein F5Y15DRAFT_333731 [Xylariaceae sp. FL0016]
MRERGTSPGSKVPAPSDLETAALSGTSIRPDRLEDVVDAGLVTMEQAEMLVSRYRARMVPHFPFVVLAPEVTAARLRVEKPFLFLCILSVASFDTLALQIRIGDVVRREVSDRMVSGDAISIEVLQGLLVFIAWSHYHPRPCRYVQYLHLAISIVVDLRLDRSPTRNWTSIVGSSRDDAAPLPEWGADEQRALAGCFYFSSTTSHLLQKLKTFPYTPYLERCCFSLLQRGEFPTDEHIYYAVQLQRIMETIDFDSLQHSTQDEATAVVTNVRLQLQNFKTNLNFDLRQNNVLYMRYHTAELFLCQAAFLDKAIHLDAHLHSELVYASFAAAKAVLEHYLSLPEGAETAFNHSEWIQIGFTLTVASRLTVASHYQYRRLLNLPDLWHRLSRRMHALVTDQQDDNGDRDLFFRNEQRLRGIQAWFDRSAAQAWVGDTLDLGSAALPVPLPGQVSGGAPLMAHAQMSQAMPPASVPDINIIPTTGPSPLPHEPGLWDGDHPSPPLFQSASDQQLQIPELFPESDLFFQDWGWSFPSTF